MIPQWITPAGNIASIPEGNSFSFTLNYNNPLMSPATVSIIAGSLPSGLFTNSTGAIFGTVDLVEVPSTFTFVARVQNSAGISDRTFSIDVVDATPIWADPNNLGSFPFYSFFSYDFFLTDPGSSKQEFLKISGELPPGLVLDKNGQLSGVLEEVTADTTYTFTIRAFLDGAKFEDRTFTLEVLVSGNRPPIWFTPSGFVGDIFGSIPFSFQFEAKDPDGDPVTFSASSLPPGFTISSSGLLQGTLLSGTPQIFSFSVTASDISSSVNRTFKLNANKQEFLPVDWITKEGFLGNICEGEKSLFQVTAKSDSSTLFYEVTSGTLPPGLQINPNNGEFWGRVQEQGLEQTYIFDITVSNSSDSKTREFAITVLNCLNPSAQEILIPITGTLRDQYFELNANPAIAYAYSSWFRQGDKEFGIKEIPEIKIINNLQNTPLDDIYSVIADMEESYIIFGEVESKKVEKNGVYVYDILYRKVYDQLANSTAIHTNPPTGGTVEPGAIEHVRSRLIDNFGFSGGDEIVEPEFLDSWFPALIFAYLKPNTGEDIAQQINLSAEDNKELEKVQVKFDRILVRPLADNTFEPTLILGFNKEQS